MPLRFLNIQHLSTAKQLLHSAALRRNASNSAIAGGIRDPLAYCQEVVKRHDHESWLCSYFYPQSARPGYFALKAFFIELAMIPDTVSSAAIGQMRLQFWKDTVSLISKPDPPPQHPIAVALHETAKTSGIQQYHLKRIVEARYKEMESPDHISLDGLTAHAESTYSTLNYSLLELLGAATSSHLSHAASHLGVAHNFMTLVRGIPHHASRRHCVIPVELTSKYGVNQEDLFRHGGDAKNLEDTIYAFAVAANDNLLTAREQFLQEPARRTALPVFLSGAVVQSFLTRLESAKFNVFDPSLQARYWKLPWQIYRANAKGSF